jgi:hypothetical protein
VLEDLRELPGHAVDLVVAQLQARELRHMEDLVPVDHRGRL